MTEKPTHKSEIHQTEEGGFELNALGMAILSGALAVGSFWAYFNGYQLALKKLSLGKYSFLVVGILLVIVAVFHIYNHFTETAEEKK